MRTPLPRRWPWPLAGIVLLPLALAATRPPSVTATPDPNAATAPPTARPRRVEGLIQPHDRIAVVGSSSTRIGTWVRTLEYLIHTRYPTWDIELRSFTTGGGTFETGRAHLDGWLADFRPTLVIFNYGGNDAKAGREGLPTFLENLDACVAKAEAAGARVMLITPQAADVRRSGREAAALRTLYAETMLQHGRDHGLPVIDVHHPLEALQCNQQRREPHYTILRDAIHLTHAAYVAWGYYLFDRLDLPYVRSEATLTASGKVVAVENCMIRDVARQGERLSFTRIDRVMPILPPGHLPPREFVPLEAHSRYVLAVMGLPAGRYEIDCEGQVIGHASAAELAAGVNLNTLLLDGGIRAPWTEMAWTLWDRQQWQRVGSTPWRFIVQPAPSQPAASTVKVDTAAAAAVR